MYVCMYVCMYECMYECMYVRTYLCICVCMNVCMYARSQGICTFGFSQGSHSSAHASVNARHGVVIVVGVVRLVVEERIEVECNAGTDQMCRCACICECKHVCVYV